MIVKIKQCSNNHWWYVNRIGFIYEVANEPDKDGSYRIMEEIIYGGEKWGPQYDQQLYIDKRDIELFEEDFINSDQILYI